MPRLLRALPLVLLLALAGACEIAPDLPPEAYREDDDAANADACSSTALPDVTHSDFDDMTCLNAGERCGRGCGGGLARERCACAGRTVCHSDGPVCLGPNDLPVVFPLTQEEICGNGIDDDCDGIVDEGCSSCP